MIKKVTNYSRKSYDNYTGPDNEFKRINIIFGYNGRGKSSLAEGLIELHKTQNADTNSFRYYNKRYIHENVLLTENDNSRIKGVVANFGKKDIGIEKDIADAQAKIQDVSPIKSEIEKTKNTIMMEISDVHNRRRGDLKIQKKPSSKSLWEVMELYDADLENAKRIVKDTEELRNAKGDDSYELKKEAVERIVIPKIELLTSEELGELSSVLERTFDSIDIPNNMVVQWIEEGLKLHGNNDRCLFCDNKIEIEEIEKKLERYKDNEKQKAAQWIYGIKVKLENQVSKIEELTRACRELNEIKPAGIESKISIIDDAALIIKRCVEKLNIKIERIEEKIDFDIKILKEAIISIEDMEKHLTDIRYGLITEYDKKAQEIGTIVKGAIALEIKESTSIQSNVQQLRRNEENLEDIEKKNKFHYNQIDIMKKSKSSTRDFAKHLSSILESIEMNLKLDLEGDDYVIKHPGTDEVLSVDDISEGEQNLLGLLYFYYELFEDEKQMSFKDEIELVVVDDPVSSVDDINRMHVLELMNRICQQKTPQVFIFTHMWEDFCNLCYGKKDDAQTDYRFYEIKKGSQGSYIDSARTTDSPYKHNFKEIYDFSQKKDASLLDEMEIYHYPNIMRRILEEFLTFKAPNHTPTQKNKVIITHVLCGDSPSAKESLSIGVLLNVCNIMSHRVSRNPDEILSSAKFLMNRIKDVDKDHYNTMIR